MQKLFLILLLPMFFCGNASAEICLSNDVAEVVISPEKGGCVTSFKDILTGVEYASGHGICVDIYPGAAFPGVLREKIYREDAAAASSGQSATLESEAIDAGGAFNLAVRKEFKLDGSRLDVKITFINRLSESAAVEFRTQNVFRNRKGMLFTLPVAEGLRVIDPGSDANPKPESELAGNWESLASPETRSGMLFRFDAARKGRAYNWYNASQLGQELYFAPVTVAPSEAVSMVYSLELLRDTEPVVAVLGDLAVGLDTPKLKTGFNYTASLTPLAGQSEVEVEIAGFSGVSRHSVKLNKRGTTVLNWTNILIDKIVISSAGQESVIAETFCNDPLTKPPVPDFSGVTVPDIFPYGDYLHARPDLPWYLPPEEDAMRRNCVYFRRASMNTLIAGDLFFPADKRTREFAVTGEVLPGKLAEEYAFKIINAMEMYHWRLPETVFRDDADVRADFERRGYSVETVKAICEKYRKSIILHSTGDEPLPEWLPDVVVGNEFFRRNIDGRTPVSPIFNLATKQYMPYVPVFYGDAYATHHAGSDIYYIAPLIRESVREGAGSGRPVWVMLQAFGEFRNYNFDWRLPTREEMRFMIYSSVANGAKGILFHANPGSPAWISGGYSRPALDAFGFRTPAFEAIGECGAKLTALGALLRRADFDDFIDLDSPYIGDAASSYRGRAVRLGILKLPGGNLLMAVNHDVKNPSSAQLKLNGKNLPGKYLVDLFSAEANFESGAISKTITLAPGDAACWFYGTRDGAGEAFAEVELGRMHNELELLKIEERSLRVNGADTAEILRLLSECDGELSAKQPSSAREILKSVREAAGTAAAGLPGYSEIRVRASKIRSVLESAAVLIGDNPRCFFSLDVEVKPGQLRRNTSDAAADELIHRVNAAALKMLELEDKILFRGGCTVNPAAADALLAEAESIACETTAIIRKNNEQQ